MGLQRHHLSHNRTATRMATRTRISLHIITNLSKPQFLTTLEETVVETVVVVALRGLGNAEVEAAVVEDGTRKIDNNKTKLMIKLKIGYCLGKNLRMFQEDLLLIKNTNLRQIKHSIRLKREKVWLVI